MDILRSSVDGRQEGSSHYDFSSPLWDQYFQRVRSQVRFPRNYREVSAIDPSGCTLDQ